MQCAVALYGERERERWKVRGETRETREREGRDKRERREEKRERREEKRERREGKRERDYRERREGKREFKQFQIGYSIYSKKISLPAFAQKGDFSMYPNTNIGKIEKIIILI